MIEYYIVHEDYHDNILLTKLLVERETAKTVWITGSETTAVGGKPQRLEPPVQVYWPRGNSQRRRLDPQPKRVAGYKLFSSPLEALLAYVETLELRRDVCARRLNLIAVQLGTLANKIEEMTNAKEK